MRAGIVVLFALAAAAVAVWATGIVFDKMVWPIFHTGGIMHGSVCVLFPAYVLLFAGVAWLIVRK
jgi:hypothetical protein